MYFHQKWFNATPLVLGVLVMGTDGELNLSNPLLNVSQSAMHLRCDMHMKDNIKSKLSSLGALPAIGKEYIADIFGREGEAELVHCQNGTEFDRDLQKRSGKQDMQKALTFTSTL